MIQTSRPSLLDRFRSLLAEREEELGVSDDYGVSGLSTEGIVQIFEIVLSDLTTNSKPAIGELTMIAGEHRDHSDGISDAICARIFQRRETDPGDVNPYRTAFGRKRKGRDASASPKRRSGASLTSHTSKNERNFSSSLQHHGRNPVTANDQYDADHPGFITSSVRSQKLPPPGNSGRVSNIGRAEDLDFPKTKLKSFPISPSRIWPARSPPSDNEFTREKSPARALHSKFAYKHRKSSPLDGNRDNFVAEYKPDDSHQLLESSWSYSLNNGYNQQSPRALIDAYGNDRGKKTFNEESLKVDINSNRVTNKAVTKSWQNDDEDEYMWEDMSPTLTNQKSNDFISSNFPPASLSTRASLAMPSVSISKPNFRRGSWDSHAPFSMVDDAVTSTKEGISILGVCLLLCLPYKLYMLYSSIMANKYLVTSYGCQYAASQRQGSHYSQESWKTQQHLPQLTSAHMSFSTNQMSPAEQDMSSSIDKRLNTEAYFQRPSNTVLRMDTSGSDSATLPLASTVNNLKRRHQSPSKASSTFPPANGSVSHPRSLLPSFSQQNQIKDHNVLMDLHNPLMGQSQLADQQAGSISLNQQRQKQAAPLWPQGIRPRNAHENFSSSFPAETYSLTTQQPWKHRYNPNIHGSTTRSDISSQNSGLVSSSLSNDRRSNTSFHVNQYHIHPLPVGVPNPSQMGTTFQNMGPAASFHPESNVFSGLINSLVAQGLISAAPSASVQDSVDVEFNTDLSKIRYKSAINALYCDLPRKCTTCGLRFKCQEKHSSHMDWHVTKNRVSKNYKQKPSRKWFVSTSVWLSGAEAVGSDAIPKFWSNEVNLEEKVEKEIAVLADENQDACALCGEPFDNFYSDEIEEWMYRGAVYLNAPNGSTSMDRSQLGPIIHAKCRSASEVITLEDFGLEK